MTTLIAVVLTGLGFFVLGVAFLVIRLMMRRQENSPAEDETRMVQDMYRTLERLEKRVEVLETLLDRDTPTSFSAREDRHER